MDRKLFAKRMIYLHTHILYISIDLDVYCFVLIWFFDMFKSFFGLQRSYTKREVTNKKIPQTIVFQTQNTENKGRKKDTSCVWSDWFFFFFSLFRRQSNCFNNKTMVTSLKFPKACLGGIYSYFCWWKKNPESLCRHIKKIMPDFGTNFCSR